MSIAAISISMNVDGPTAGAIVALVGVMIGIWVNGDRTKTQRRRDLHARALESITAYGEMPFVIRRRRCEEENRSDERVRISSHFSAVKSEIETCRALLSADGFPRPAKAFENLYVVARTSVGQEAHSAWKEEPITSDEEMNMGALHDGLGEFRQELEKFSRELGWATLPRRKKLWRTVLGRAPAS